MKRKTYEAIDIAKFVSALLVVCIHTFPFADISDNANFVVVSILARLAVPFFFITSAFFFFQKIDLQQGWKSSENLNALKTYLFRLLKIYLIWSIIYLPYTFLLMKGSGFHLTTFLRYVRDFFFTGSYYHLWFLPALMFAVTAVYFLVMKLGIKKTILISFVLYLFGMAGNLYPDMLAQIPGVSTAYQAYLNVFVTTRNGLFFGMIFVSMGCFACLYPTKLEINQMSLYSAISFILLVMECVFLKMNGLIQDLSSMYLMLIPCVYFLFIRLLKVEMKHKPMYRTFRVLSLLIYVSHILFAQLFIWFTPDMNSFMFYVLTVGGSFLLSYLIYHLSKQYPIFKHLY